MVEAQNYNSTFKQRVVESDIDFGVFEFIRPMFNAEIRVPLEKSQYFFFF